MVQSCFLLRGGQETSQKVPPYLPGGGLINPMLALNAVSAFFGVTCQMMLVWVCVIMWARYQTQNRINVNVCGSLPEFYSQNTDASIVMNTAVILHLETDGQAKDPAKRRKWLRRWTFPNTTTVPAISPGSTFFFRPEWMQVPQKRRRKLLGQAERRYVKTRCGFNQRCGKTPMFDGKKSMD